MLVYKTNLGKLIHGDCLEIMSKGNSESIDLVLCDLPFGTTYQSWDKCIDFKLLWAQYRRIVKSNAAIVLYSSQPFTTLLINSAIDIFKYTWIWNKENPTNFPNAKIQPLKQHEEICVFYKEQCQYYPQKTLGKINHKQGKSKTNISEIRLIKDRVGDDLSGLKYPKSILNYPKHSSHCKFHPNQKPVELCEYLIKTYTNENDLVLDNCAGSGTTAIACENLNRRWICIEKEEKYFNIAKERIEQHIKIN